MICLPPFFIYIFINYVNFLPNNIVPLILML